MADLSNSSFIPKRGPTGTPKRGGSVRRVYVFTLISYILMFATLLATGGVFLYGGYINRQLESEVASLNAEIESFNEADMEKVKDFDLRLSQASSRLNNSVSLVSVFTALETATINSVQLVSLALERQDDEKFLLSAAVETDSFDSTIFQRDIFEGNKTISAVNLSDVTLTESTDTGEEGESGKSIASFTAELEIPLSAVPYTVKSDTSAPKPHTVNIDVNIGPVSDTEVNNEENI